MMKPENTPTEGVKLAPIFEGKLAQLEARDRSPKTIHNYVRAVVPFQVWLDGRGLDALDVTPEDVELYLAHCAKEYRDSIGKRGYSPGTRRIHFNYIKSAYRLAVDRGKLSAMPFGSVEIPKVPEHVPEVIPVEELHRMGLAARLKSWKHLALWALLCYTGLRKDEIRRLRWEDIDLTGGELSIVGKGGKARTVPLHPVLQRVLESGPYPEGGPTKRTGCVLVPNGSDGSAPYSNGEGFTKLLRAFSSRDDFHGFRKTVASSLFANGVQQADIETILGWATKSVFAKHYLVRRPGHLAACISKLYADGDPAVGVVLPMESVTSNTPF